MQLSALYQAVKARLTPQTWAQYPLAKREWENNRRICALEALDLELQHPNEIWSYDERHRVLDIFARAVGVGPTEIGTWNDRPTTRLADVHAALDRASLLAAEYEARTPRRRDEPEWHPVPRRLKPVRLVVIGTEHRPDRPTPSAAAVPEPEGELVGCA